MPVFRCFWSQNFLKQLISDHFFVVEEFYRRKDKDILKKIKQVFNCLNAFKPV
jgi:hypothetical protein